jgi:hypothetical protein
MFASTAMISSSNKSRRSITGLAITVLIFHAELGMAAEPDRHRADISEVLVAILPIVIVVGLMLLFFPLLLRWIKKSSGADRYYEHLERIEAQLKRIADAIEKNKPDQEK